MEAGCGWGALALHMARHYGVTVRAFNISHEQIQFARARARQEGLEEQVEFVEDDYRNIHGSFDVFVSVGMLEHVGPEHYKQFGRVIHRTVGDEGRGLLHFIGRNRPLPLQPVDSQAHLPGGSVPTIREAMDIFEDRNYSVLDVENLRLHYAKTLEHWLDRFERSADVVEKEFGTEFVRAWRVYLAGSMAAFRMGTLQLFQIVFCGRDCRKIPWTRAHLYAEAAKRRERPPVASCDAPDRGGGPAGSTCARAMRRGGLDVILLDKRKFPRDKTCGGWITPAVLDLLEIDPVEDARERVLQPITGFRTSWMGGAEVETRYGATVSYGVRRYEFDDYLLKRSARGCARNSCLNRWNAATENGS